MKISIIMPSLNVVEYIDECIKSVLNQTLTDIEILCVDAGSEDGTWEKLEQYASNDVRVKLFRSERKSYGYQMNLGIKAAKGEYIGIVETDDWVTPDMFQKLYTLTKDTDVDFVKSGYKCFFDKNDKRYCAEQKNFALFKVREKVIDLKEQEKFRLADINHIWSGIYRRSFLVDKGLWFNETEGASFQDTSFSVLVGMLADKCIYTSGSYYYYRTDRPESSVKSSKKYKCVIDEMNYINAYMEEHGLNNWANQLKIAQLKLATYSWNMNRLTDESRNLFRNEIINEMKDYLPGGKYNKALTNSQLQVVDQLIDPEKLKIVDKTRELDKKNIIDIFRCSQNKGKLVFVGAGCNFRKFLYYEELSKTTVIKAVCDNNKKLQGTIISKYEIKSVESAVEENIENLWIVSSRVYAEQLIAQLKSLGVPDKNIIRIYYLPEPIEFLFDLVT